MGWEEYDEILNGSEIAGLGRGKDDLADRKTQSTVILGQTGEGEAVDLERARVAVGKCEAKRIYFVELIAGVNEKLVVDWLQ